MSTVSIVMATYNGEKYLREQIDSILENTYTDWKLEICDDGSKDQSIVIAKEYEANFPDKIQVHVNKKNLGFVHNFLQGAQRAKGKYVMFCDQDDVWLPSKIEHTLQYIKKMEKHYGVDMPLAVFTDAKVVDAKKRELHPSFFQSGKLDATKLDLRYLLMENKLIGCTVLFNRKVLDYLSVLPQEARYHDWWIGIIVASFGKIGFLKESTLLYRQHEKNVVGNQNFLSYITNRISSLRKQKEALVSTERQAYNILKIFQNQLPLKEKRIITEFSMLGKRNWFARRRILIKYGYWKTGMVRNIGVFLIL